MIPCDQYECDEWHKWNVQIWRLQIIFRPELVVHTVSILLRIIEVDWDTTDRVLAPLPLLFFEQEREQNDFQFVKDVRVGYIEVHF